MTEARAGDFELVTLRNGQRAVRHLPSGEVMHPSVGPWSEANRLYVDQLELATRLRGPSELPLRIYDVGLGAGTNAIAALACARSLGPGRRRSLELVSFERDLDPLKLAARDPDGFPHQAAWAAEVEALLGSGVWEGDGMCWRVLEGELLDRLPTTPGPAHVVFFDPFSPRANPGLWTVAALARLRAACDAAEGAVLATYSAATPTRVALLLAGFFVGVGVGVGTKSETTVASTLREGLREPLGEAFLERWRRSTSRGPHGEPLTEAHEAKLLAHPQFRSA